MIKKGLLKKLVALSMVGIMSLAFVGCGEDSSSDKEDKEIETEADEEAEEVTEEETEEAVDEDAEEVVDEETEEDTEEVASEDGVLYDESTGEMNFNGVTATVPAGYTADESGVAAGTLSFVSSADTTANAIVVGVDNANTVTDVATAVSMFDSQIKAVYGDQCTSSEVTYNGNTVTEWVLDDAEGTYMGRSAVICDGTMLIYVEYVSMGTEVSVDDYFDFMDTLSY